MVCYLLDVKGSCRFGCHYGYLLAYCYRIQCCRMVENEEEEIMGYFGKDIFKHDPQDITFRQQCVRSDQFGNFAV
jgi:hypothetical protein